MNAYLQICDLTKRYGATPALKSIELAVDRGQVLALLGPNGAGKSTLFGCLLGFTLPTAGTILLNGRPLTDADRTGFGYAAERIALYPQRTVSENAGFFAGLRRLHRRSERPSRLPTSASRNSVRTRRFTWQRPKME